MADLKRGFRTVVNAIRTGKGVGIGRLTRVRFISGKTGEATMTLPLDPAMLEAAYEFLRATPPFRHWRLPAGDAIEFQVIASPGLRGRCVDNGDHQTIAISLRTIGHTHSLMMAMAHEMIHVRDNLAGIRAHHGASFRRSAAVVCRYHGFDPKLF